MNWGAIHGSATTCERRGERYVLGVPCHTTMRDLEAPAPTYQGRGRRANSTLAIGECVAHIPLSRRVDGGSRYETVRKVR